MGNTHIMDTEERYEILDKAHGKGGFGEISKQRDRFLDRLVAVKRLHMFADDESKQRFIHEAKTLARMSHPNVPAIYDVKFKEDEMMIYFEFIEGKNLRQILDSGTIPSIQQAVPWFSQVALALDHSSSLGIIHRDVKPENIIVSKSGSAAYLVDFGIALTADDVRRITETGYVIGTPAYMSPEQRAGEELDGTSDIYSLGLTLYECLSGHLPLMGRQYESLSDSNEAIPPSVDELIKACLVPDKKRRLASAKEFTQRLQGAFRTDVPLSVLLMDARLHELQAALQSMSAEEFSAKPKGQKLLILNRVKDLIRTDKIQLQKPTAEMIAVLVRLAIDELPEQYKMIVDVAYEWGYEKPFGENWQGDAEIRDALINAAKVASVTTHTVLASSLLDFAEKVQLEDQQGWYYHDLRGNLISLLANPHCGDVADQLASLYDKVNEVSHL
jgi:serine/threonine protein kinase